MVAAPSIDGALLARNLQAVQARIAGAMESRRVGQGPVELVAVGKKRPIEALLALKAAGVEDFGENRAQELAAKAGPSMAGVRWHFIGMLQKNKVRLVVDRAHLIHSVHEFELAREIDRRAEKLGIIQPVLIQVNVAREAAKQGIGPENLEKLVAETAELRHIKVEGLMTIAPRVAEPEEARPVFAGLRRLYEAAGAGRSFKWLSMGMTDDFEVAIEEGANLVRVGRALFGPAPKEVR